jgi:hypothetical protein
LPLSPHFAHASTGQVVADTAPALTAHTGAAPDEATEMRKAQLALQNAENDLLHVPNEYGGHRLKSSQAITTALQELKQAQQQGFRQR